MQPRLLWLGSQGCGLKLNPGDISHESTPHPRHQAPPDTLGLFWVAEAGPRASGKCLEPTSCEAGVFPSVGRAEPRRAVLASPCWPIDNAPLEPGRRSRGPLVAGEARRQWRCKLTMGTVMDPRELGSTVGNGEEVAERLCTQSSLWEGSWQVLPRVMNQDTGWVVVVVVLAFHLSTQEAESGRSL